MIRIAMRSSGAPFTLPRHGGDLAAAEARFGRPKAGWLDLSTGINPFAYPLPPLAPEVWRRLPDPSAAHALRATAAQAWGVADPSAIVLAPGTQALIQLVPLLRPRGRVEILAPTYPGHAEAFAQAGHEVLVRTTLDEMGQAQLAVAVNPNNPDGRRLEPDALRALAARMARHRALLIVDESFAELDPTWSIAGSVSDASLVLRGFGKFFGLAGIRLGFAVCPPVLGAELREALGPWPVSGPAIEVGRVALADTSWIETMRARLAAEAGLLDGVLADHGLAVLGGTSLFRLADAPRAWALYEHLGRRGILVRPFAEQPRWLRFGLPPSAAARRRLAAALGKWRG